MSAAKPAGSRKRLERLNHSGLLLLAPLLWRKHGHGVARFAGGEL